MAVLISMISRVKLIGAIVLASLSFQGFATWYEGEGRAPLVEEQKEESRKLAVQNALVSLMYYGGASVEALQVVKSGVLETNQLSIQTRGEVLGVKILEETETDGQLVVKIAADIYPLGACSKGSFSKPTLVGPVIFSDPKQAQLGGLYDLPIEVGQKFYDEFREQNKVVDPRAYRKHPIASFRSLDQGEEALYQDLALLAERYHSQFILLTQIDDLSSYTSSVRTSVITSDDVTSRNFSMKVSLFDALQQDQVLSKTFYGQAEWPFEDTLQLDVTSQTFWSTPYGELIESLIGKAKIEIEEALYCRQSYATVVEVLDNKVMINLGRANGVKVGDQFSLAHRQNLPLMAEHPQALLNHTDVKLTVSAVQRRRAVLTATHQADLANVQIRDLLIAKPQDPFEVLSSN